MTTIAYRNGILAFDSKTSTEHATIQGNVVKGLATARGIVAASGGVQEMQAFLDWFKAGGRQKQKAKYGLDATDLDLSAIHVDPKGNVFCYDSRVYPYKLEAEFVALGSGCDFAKGAMAAGASAKKAVQIAGRFDGFTGGPTNTLSLEDCKKLKPSKTTKKKGRV